MRNQRSWRILTEVDENTSTLKVSKVIGKVDSNGDSFYPTFTDPTTVVFMSDDKKVFETCKATADGAGNLTLTKRGLSDDKSETEVSTFKKDWLPGTYMYATMGAGDLPSLNEDNTWNGEQNFEGNVNIGGELNVEGDFNMNSDGDVDITTENGTVIFQDKDVGPVTLAQMIHQTGDGTEVLIMSESEYQALDTPTVNTLYLTHYNGTKITKAHLNGINYKISDEDIHDISQKNSLNLSDELILADSESSYNQKKILGSTIFDKFSSIVVDTYGSSLVYSGLKAGENLVAGDVVTINGSNQLVKVSLSNQGLPHQMRIVRESANTGDYVAVDAGGISKKLSGLTAGSKYFVSSTAGQLTTNRSIGYLVGEALSATELDLKYFYIDTDFGTEITLYNFVNQNDSFTARTDMKVRMTYSTRNSSSSVTTFRCKTKINGVTVDTFNKEGGGYTYTYTYDATLSAGDILSIEIIERNARSYPKPIIQTVYKNFYC